MQPSRQRTLRTVCLSVERRIWNCTFKSTSQQMQSALLSFPVYLHYFKNSKILNRCELDPCVYDVFDSALAMELNTKVSDLNSWDTLYIYSCIVISDSFPIRTRKSTVIECVCVCVCVCVYIYIYTHTHPPTHTHTHAL
jgi:hypothetical protein